MRDLLFCTAKGLFDIATGDAPLESYGGQRHSSQSRYPLPPCSSRNRMSGRRRLSDPRVSLGLLRHEKGSVIR